MVQDGDLPAGVTAGQLRENPAGEVEDLPAAAQTVYPDFVRDANPAGDVVVWRYPARADAVRA